MPLRIWLLVLCTFSAPAFTGQLVRVGAYQFPPYVIQPESFKPTGVLPDLLSELNAAQNDYHFELVATSASRRYRDFSSGRYDLILFEALEWGWRDTPKATLDLKVTDAEVYVAHALQGRDQTYFDSLAGKRVALFGGYHYGFAGLNADRRYLTDTFKAVLTYSHQSNLLMVQHGRAELAVVPVSYLQHVLEENPQQREELLVSARKDQVFHLQALIRPNSPIDSKTLARWLGALEQSGRLSTLLSRYHLQNAEDQQEAQASPMHL